MLVIELDGGQHNDGASQTYDRRRSAHLKRLGWRVIRFWNFEVIENIECVLVTITQALTQNQQG